MSTQIKRRRGSTSDHASFTGAVGELTVDTDKDVVVVHDGATQGGFPMLRDDASNAQAATIRANIGLEDQTADLDLNSVSINGTDLFPNGSPQALGEPDSPTFAGGTFNGDVVLSGSNRLFSNRTMVRAGGSVPSDGAGIEMSYIGGSIDTSTILSFDRDAGQFSDLEFRADVHKFTDGTVVIGDDSMFGSETLRSVGASRLEGDVTYTTQLASDDYVSGILGTGSIVDNDATGGSFFEIDNMRVRKEFRTHIFRKDTVRATNGFFYVSDVSEVVEEKTFGNTDTGVTLDIKAGSSYATFTVGDELLVKNVDPDEGGNNFVEFEVTAVDTSDPDFTRLTVDIINSNGGTVYEGDTIVRTSGGVLVLDAVTANSPFMDVAEDSSMKVRLGNLDGVTNASGWGLYGENTFLTESLLVGDLTKAGNYMEYASGTLTIEADAFDLSVNTLVLNSTTPKIALGAAADSLGVTSTSDTGTFLNGSGHVRVGTTDASGNLDKGFTFDGTDFLLEAGNASIGASSGWFGADDILTYSASSVGLAGFTADSDKLTNGNVIIGNNIGSLQAPDTVLVGNFSDGATPFVRAIGDTTDTFVQMVGHSASSGNVFQIRSAGVDVVTISGDEARIAGWNFDDTDLWAGGDGTKANATVRLDAANGAIFYDAMGSTIHTATRLASFGDGTTIGLPDREWTETVSRSADGTSRDQNRKGIVNFIKRFGENTLIVSGWARMDVVAGSEPVLTAHVTEIIVDVRGTALEESANAPISASYQQFTIEVDISGLTNGDLFLVEIDLAAEVEVTDGDGATYSTTGYLLEQMTVRTGT